MVDNKKEYSLQIRSDFLYIIRYSLLISILDVDDAAEMQSITGLDITDICPILCAVDAAIKIPNAPMTSLKLTYEDWVGVKDSILTVLDGIHIWKKYESISKYSYSDMKKCLRFIKSEIDEMAC